MTAVRRPPAFYSLADLVGITGLSLSTLKRRSASGDVPGRIKSGRRVLFHSSQIETWLAAGMPESALAARQSRR